MDNHVFMCYDDSNTKASKDADQTHATLLNMGYRVLHSEAGYNTTRIEYVRL